MSIFDLFKRKNNTAGAGISLLDNAEDMLVRFLEQAKELSDSMKDYYIRDAWDISASTINSSQT